MSELRKRMNDAMVLRGFAERTKQSYLGCIVALAKHYRRPPETLDTAAIQAYLLHLIPGGHPNSSTCGRVKLPHLTQHSRG